MPRIEPLEREELTQYKSMFNQLEEFFGFLPNDYLTMARKDGLLEAVASLTHIVFFGESTISQELKFLLPYGTSRAAGCMYCVGHSAALADRHGVSLEKIENIHEFQSHPAFSEAERAALQVAQNASTNPNSVTDEEFDVLRKHFSDEQVVDIVAVIAMMGFYNRWNDTLATTLEKPPSMFSEKNIAKTGWAIGKHG